MGLNLKNLSKVTTRSGRSIKKIRRRSDLAILWSAEEYIFQNGALASGVTASGFTLQDGYLFAYSDDDSENLISIQNIDMTNYSKADIELDYRADADYGSASVKYGIDGYTSNELEDKYNRVSTTITLDITSYVGSHFIGFRLYCRNDSDEPTYGAWANVWIKSIKLYN